MTIQRKIINIYTPYGEPGFLGAGHTARPVITGPFSVSDPFIMLMDDHLDKKDDQPVGGPHPHAGFETVTLLLEGEIGDNAHKMKSGDFQIMTAGSGIVHTETIEKKARLRLLQLWLNLPKKDRHADPRVQDLPLEHVPTLESNGTHIKLYSGKLANMVSRVQNYTPLIVADIRIASNVTYNLNIPANYNTFLYILDGAVRAGNEMKLLEKDNVAWLDLHPEDVQSELKLSADDKGLRFVLYAGKPTGEPIVSHGPFIGDSSENIARLYSEYRQGKMHHIATVPPSQRILL